MFKNRAFVVRMVKDPPADDTESEPRRSIDPQKVDQIVNGTLMPCVVAGAIFAVGWKLLDTACKIAVIKTKPGYF
jgi:hypothetical protein